MKDYSMDLNHLIESIPDPIIVIDHNKIIQFVNKSTESLFGFSREFLTKNTVELLLSRQGYKRFSCYFLQHLENPKKTLTAHIKLTSFKKNKARFPVKMYFSPLQKHHLTLITIKDLTCETQLVKKNKKLEHLHHLKDRFFSIMNHQFRTPLNAILGFSEILLLKLTGELTPEQEKHIGIIHKSGKYLLKLIDDLTELARINANEITFHIETFNAQELIQDIMHNLYSLAEEKKLLFVNNKIPNKSIIINSDKKILTQIITNIINNAIKFTDQGSVSVELTEDKNKVFVHVIDTGVGIQEEKVNQLFEAFQQLFISEKKSEGSGLSLHMSKKLADLIHVKLKVLSHYGRGTHFTIIIPKLLNK